MHEHQIRDYIAENLYLLSPDLHFVEKEFRIDPVDGSRAYIDILAISLSKYVILEIKRSDQSARSATNEISKYVEGLKRKLSLNDDNIRIVLVSTHWQELKIPYAYMAERLGIPCEGYLIEWDDGRIVRICHVEIPKLVGTRLFSPAHVMCMYHNHDELEKGLKSVEEIFLERQIEDYVVIKLCAPPGHYEWVAEANRAQAAAIGLSPSIFDGNDERYDYSLYIAFLRKDVEVYRKLLACDKDILEETDCQISDTMMEDEILLVHEHALWSLTPFPYSNYIEIGYPAKFAHKILEDEGWQVREIKRYGTLANNLILADKDVIAEVGGNQGVDKGRVQSSAAIGNFAELSRLESEIRRCLGNDNVAWREQLLFVLRSFRSDNCYADCRIFLSLISPNNFLLSLFNEIRDPDKTHTYLPNFQLIVVGPDDELQRLYVGQVVWSGEEPDFDKVVRKYFEGDVMKLVVSMGCGGFLSNDVEIMADLSLSYATFLVEVDELGKATKAEMLKDFMFVENMAAFNSLQRLINNHEEFLEELVECMDRHVRGSYYMSSFDDYDIGSVG
jgi:hypothetical protein